MALYLSSVFTYQKRFLLRFVSSHGRTFDEREVRVYGLRCTSRLGVGISDRTMITIPMNKIVPILKISFHKYKKNSSYDKIATIYFFSIG